MNKTIQFSIITHDINAKIRKECSGCPAEEGLSGVCALWVNPSSWNLKRLQREYNA